MSFAHPYVLLLLLLLPVLAWLKGKVGFQPAFLYSSVQLVRGITGITRSRAGSVLLKLRWLALALFIIALARPQIGEGETKITASGIDIVLAIDLSGSMSSEDFQLRGQRVNRLIIAKDVLQQFIAKRPNDRIGLVAFATDAYIAAPLTLDHDGEGAVALSGNIDHGDAAPHVRTRAREPVDHTTAGHHVLPVHVRERVLVDLDAIDRHRCRCSSAASCRNSRRALN